MFKHGLCSDKTRPRLNVLRVNDGVDLAQVTLAKNFRKPNVPHQRTTNPAMTVKEQRTDPVRPEPKCYKRCAYIMPETGHYTADRGSQLSADQQESAHGNLKMPIGPAKHWRRPCYRRNDSLQASKSWARRQDVMVCRICPPRVTQKSVNSCFPAQATWSRAPFKRPCSWA